MMLLLDMYRKIMKRDFALGLLVAGTALLSASSLPAVEIVPASMHDIVNALGPDANGLALTQEALPDLFTLTANRIEEDPKLFTIAPLYTSGRWKGGKAVIEYARDLSYTQVSVYDREGHRQRIYSVRTQYTEHVEHLKAQAQVSSQGQSAVKPTSAASPAEPIETASVPSPSLAKPAASPAPAKVAEPKFSYEWDEAKAAYIPVATSAVAVDAAQMQEPAPRAAPPVVVAEAPAEKEEPAPRSHAPKRRSHHDVIEKAKAPAKSVSAAEEEESVRVPPKPSQSAAVKVKVANTTWVERRPAGTEETPPERPRRRKKVNAVQETPPAAEKPAVVAAPPAKKAAPIVVALAKPAAETAPAHSPQGHWVPREVSERPIPAKEAEALKRPVVEEGVPSEDELLGLTPAAPSAAASEPQKKTLRVEVVQKSEPPPSTKPAAKSLSRPEAAVAKAPVLKAVPIPVVVQAQAPRAVPVSAAPAEEPESPPAPKSVHHPQASAARAPVLKPAPEPVIAEARAPKVEPVPAAPPASPVASAPVSVGAVSSPVQAPEETKVPSTEDLLVSNNKKSGPDTSDRDAWVPKETPKSAASEPAEPMTEPIKVAMVPKAAPVDNSVENLLKIANTGGGGAPHESEAWVPQKTKTPKLDVDIDREVARIRSQENKQSAERKASKIKRDVNNPEEGVLPVSTFEKYSGPMYGRHREYERRFVPGKNKRAKVPDHDFYVDEIDRKKEIHNTYFYIHQTGKGPRLIAVERHEKVSFLGNYDIDKEDKGKLSTYN